MANNKATESKTPEPNSPILTLTQHEADLLSIFCSTWLFMDKHYNELFRIVKLLDRPVSYSPDRELPNILSDQEHHKRLTASMKYMKSMLTGTRKVDDEASLFNLRLSLSQLRKNYGTMLAS